MILFGAGVLIATPLLDASGAAVSNPTPVRVAVLQDISVDIDFETKMLHGEKQFPVAIGRGKAKLGWKAKSGDFSFSALSSRLLGSTASAARRAAVIDAASTVPSTPYQVTIAPPSSGVFAADLGVIAAATGVTLTRVASSPATGQYSVNTATGVYTFASADTGLSMLISYEYTIASSATSTLATISNNLMGYTPTFSGILYNTYGGKTFALKLNNNVLGKMALPFKNDDFTMQDIDADAFADSSGTIGYACSY